MSEQTKQILLVDDDRDLVGYLVNSLGVYQSLSFVTASNGKEAVEVLSNGPVDLVVTDIQMPEMDGFSLVSHISREFPKLPVIIITSHATPSMEHKLTRMGIVTFEKKPIDVDVLANRIFDLLVGVDSGYVQGISIPSFLQILQADRKTCTLKISDGSQTGYLHLLYGKLVDAEIGDLRGEKAAMVIIGWEGSLTIDIQSVLRLKEKTISTDLTVLMMETFRQMDEGVDPTVDNLYDMDALSLPDRSSIPPATHSSEQALCTNPGMAVETVIDDEYFGEALESLFDVKGYKASAVMTHDGRLLSSHTKNRNTDIGFVTQTAHEMFCGLQKKAEMMGMGLLEESVFRTKDGIMLIRCVSDKSKPHLHVMAISHNLEGEGMMRIRLKRVVEAIAVLPEEAEEERRSRSSSPVLKGTF